MGRRKKNKLKDFAGGFLLGLIGFYFGLCLTSAIMFFTGLNARWFLALWTMVFSFVIIRKLDKPFRKWWYRKKENKEVVINPNI